MGLDYAFLLGFPRERARDVLLKLIEMASNEGTRTTLDAHLQPELDGTPPNEMLTHLNGQMLCLPISMGFDVKALSEENSDSRHGILQYTPIENGKYWIGYIYLTITFGEKNMYLAYEAATTGMSLLFRDSKVIQDQFIQITKELGGFLTAIDQQDEWSHILWIKEGLGVKIGDLAVYISAITVENADEPLSYFFSSPEDFHKR